MGTQLNKNILFFQNSILPANGGVPRVSDIISQELTRRGYNCFFVFYDKDNEAYPTTNKLRVDLKQSFTEIKQSVMQFVAENDINFFVCQNAYSAPFRKLFKHIRANYPNSRFLSFLHASPDYWLNIYKAKTDLSRHKFIINTTKKILKRIVYPFYNPYLIETKDLYNISDKCILLSESFKAPFTHIYGLKDNGVKLATIPNPLTFANYITVDEIHSKHKIALMVCRLDEGQKKISLALRIWKEVAKDKHADWQLIIVGDGPDEAFYRKFLVDNNLNNVVLAGQRSNVVDYYKQASIFMMTSIWEGLPMSLLESQQNGVVPIAFDNFSAVYDVVTDGTTGYIIKDNNMNSFADKLSKLMDDEELRRAMAINTVENSKRYHVSNIVNQWEMILKAN